MTTKFRRNTTPPIYKEIGARIRARRLVRGMTQRALAEKIGQNRASLTLIEHGKQKVAVHDLMAIAAALKISVSHLLP